MTVLDVVERAVHLGDRGLGANDSEERLFLVTAGTVRSWKPDPNWDDRVAQLLNLQLVLGHGDRRAVAVVAVEGGQLVYFAWMRRTHSVVFVVVLLFGHRKQPVCFSPHDTH